MNWGRFGEIVLYLLAIVGFVCVAYLLLGGNILAPDWW